LFVFDFTGYLANVCVFENCFTGVTGDERIATQQQLNRSNIAGIVKIYSFSFIRQTCVQSLQFS
jgi:hypothetical protein